MPGGGTVEIVRKRLARALLATLAVLPLGIGPALAASPECDQLAARLEQLIGAPAGLSIGTEAANRIDAARKRAAQLGCDRAVSGNMISACAALNAEIARMQGDFEYPAPALPQTEVRRERNRILDAMELAGCHDPDTEDQEATSAPGEHFQGTIIRGGSSEPLYEGSDYPQRIVIGRAGPQGTGEYRTLCVRTCDGYVFPLSSAATVSDFQRDQKSCEAGCPGTEVELFYHLADGEALDDMVSARSGQPYRKLSTAYRYKRTDLPRVPACGCNVSQNQNKNFSVIAGDGRPVPSAPKPTPTIAGPAPVPIQPSAAPDPNRKVRAVGPTFLPDPEAAIDLQAPALTQAR